MGRWSLASDNLLAELKLAEFLMETVIMGPGRTQEPQQCLIFSRGERNNWVVCVLPMFHPLVISTGCRFVLQLGCLHPMSSSSTITESLKSAPPAGEWPREAECAGVTRCENTRILQWKTAPSYYSFANCDAITVKKMFILKYWQFTKPLPTVICLIRFPPWYLFKL